MNFRELGSVEPGDTADAADTGAPASLVDRTMVRGADRPRSGSFASATQGTLIDVNDTRSGWTPADSTSRLSSGELVPGTRYRIVRWIGEGGMGQVFEAVHVDIQRKVALKVLRSKLGLTPEVCAAFLAEARACARISSRFVVSMTSGSRAQISAS